METKQETKPLPPLMGWKRTFETHGNQEPQFTPLRFHAFPMPDRPPGKADGPPSPAYAVNPATHETP